MAAPTPNQLAVASVCFAKSIPKGDQLGALIYLFNQISGLDMTPEELANESRCYAKSIPSGDQMGALLYLAGQILASGGGGGGTNQIFVDNYSGGQPNITPTTSTAIAFDSSNGTQWNWYDSAWHL